MKNALDRLVEDVVVQLGPVDVERRTVTDQLCDVAVLVESDRHAEDWNSVVHRLLRAQHPAVRYKQFHVLVTYV